MNLKDVLNQTPLSAQWNRVGIKHHHGINLPLNALRTKNSCGIGEFLDLLPLIDYCADIGFDVIQLLPLNDSGEDTSPYNALSSIALHSIYLSLKNLPYLENHPELSALFKDFEFFNTTERVEYHHVLEKKNDFLKKYYDLTSSLFLSLPEYEQFINANEWVKEYALYKTLKNSMSFQTWQKWPDGLSNPTLEQKEELFFIHKKWISYYSVLQYLCYKQMSQVKEYASSKNILLKGDIPILISPDSADVWILRDFFDVNFAVGYPPDVFNAEGQYWGFPALRWDILKAHNYSWWQQRLTICSYYYHLYRIDHAAGFYRLWLIEHGKKPKEGSYVPESLEKAIEEGHEYLKNITPLSPMLPIAEDLGNIPQELFNSLRSLGITGTKVMRWERDWNNRGNFFPINTYNPLSMSCISTHDSETLELWWNHYPEEVKDYCLFKHWDYSPTLDYEKRMSILKDSHKSSSLFHINLFQEYLALFPELIHNDPAKERINIPGFVLPTNWTYRFAKSLEEIIAHKNLAKALRSFLN